GRGGGGRGGAGGAGGPPPAVGRGAARPGSGLMRRAGVPWAAPDRGAGGGGAPLDPPAAAAAGPPSRIAPIGESGPSSVAVSRTTSAATSLMRSRSTAFSLLSSAVAV